MKTTNKALHMSGHIDVEEYIHHSNTRMIMAALDYEVGRRRVVPIVGPVGAGKSRLLHEWANGGSTKFKPHEILLVSIWDPKRSNLKDGTFATAKAVITFSQLYGAVSELSRPAVQHHKEWTMYWDVQTDARFASLFREVAGCIKALNIRAIVIDNSHWIDAYTLGRLMEIRGVPVARCGLILCGQMQQNATFKEPFEDQFKAVKTAALALGEWQILERLTEKEFAGVDDSVLAKIYERVGVEDVTPDVVEKEELIAKDWWARTQGDWRRIARLIEALDRALSKQKQRVVTQTVIDETNRFLNGVE